MTPGSDEGDAPDEPTSPASRAAIGLFFSTAALLLIELAAIRWMSGQVRVFAYFNNLVLMSAFLGMGLGIAASLRRPWLGQLSLPAMALLAVAVVGSGQLGIDRIGFPDDSVHLWGAETRGELQQFALAITLMLAYFALLVIVFTAIGGYVGRFFRALRPLTAYTWDLLGSLAGIVGFTALTALSTPPAVWFAVGGGLLMALSLWPPRRRTPTTVAVNTACLACVLILAAASSGDIYSPYNRIDVAPGEAGSIQVQVNRDFHQFIHDLSDEALAGQEGEKAEGAQRVRRIYEMPFSLGAGKDRAVVVGAGTGNDVMGALRAGMKHVVSVDIDPRIIDLGRARHPEAPYSSPHVKPLVQDARAFFESYEGPRFDVVCFGLLDSHAMFSAMSSLRLESFLYTEEGLRSAWELVDDDGVLVVSFSTFGGSWLTERLFWTLVDATGRPPLVAGHGMHYGYSFIVPGADLTIDTSALATFTPWKPTGSRGAVRTTSDDWPFLYLKPGAFPLGYVTLLAFILFFASLAVRQVYGRGGARFEPAMFALGAAFLLLETRGVTSLSLLFGTTWLVNAFVFSGILTTVLCANLAVERFQLNEPRPWFVPLLLSLGLLAVVDVGSLNQLDLIPRGIVGGLLVGLPVGFAGVVFSLLLKRARDPAGALGSNVLGAIVGGALEYLSMFIGLRAVLGIAAVLYLFALVHTLTHSGRGRGDAD